MAGHGDGRAGGGAARPASRYMVATCELRVVVRFATATITRSATLRRRCTCLVYANGVRVLQSLSPRRSRKGWVVIELASVIRDLRAELEEAVAAADGAALLFELGPIELEVSLAIDQTSSKGAKVQFWVVQGGADGKVSTSDTQRIKLTLNPKLAIGGGSPAVAGLALPGER